KKTAFYALFFILSYVLLVTTVLFVLSPLYIYIAVKLRWKNGPWPVIKVRKADAVSDTFFEYRFHPLLTRKSKILQMGNKLLKKYSMLKIITNR
ncbi:MAG: hypothetical protein JXR41_14375, partial [Bacteroidales bacterium]|nr:hypothetical protein [Bacteroidales bacterium]